VDAAGENEAELFTVLPGNGATPKGPGAGDQIHSTRCDSLRVHLGEARTGHGPSDRLSTKYGTSRVARDRADQGVKKKVAVGINCEADALCTSQLKYRHLDWYKHCTEMRIELHIEGFRHVVKISR
jgi:hypothetical protein